MIFDVLMGDSAITRSRKRKLRELFAVATAEDGIPTGVPTDPDAPPTSDTEARFLEGNDILQYVVFLSSKHFGAI
jgi:chromatin modification-related protein VID21